MAVKIRLQRGGKKRAAYYSIVVADARSPRDGRLIERIGSYNPNTNPATIVLNVDKAVSWLQNGAQPTDTVRSILSYKGAMYKNHLLKGVAKGALTEADADKKFAAWLSEKESKIEAKADGLAQKVDANIKAKLAAEKEISDKRAAEIVAKNSPLAEEEAVEAATSAEAPAAEPATTEEAPSAEVKTEEASAEATASEGKAAVEEPAKEEKPEAKAEEKKEETPAAEASENKEDKKEESAE